VLEMRLGKTGKEGKEIKSQNQISTQLAPRRQRAYLRRVTNPDVESVNWGERAGGQVDARVESARSGRLHGSRDMTPPTPLYAKRKELRSSGGSEDALSFCFPRSFRIVSCSQHVVFFFFFFFLRRQQYESSRSGRTKSRRILFSCSQHSDNPGGLYQ